MEQLRLEHTQMSKQFLQVKSQLEHEKNERNRLELLERPEHDFELDLAQKKNEFETQLTEKNVELEHLGKGEIYFRYHFRSNRFTKRR